MPVHLALLKGAQLIGVNIRQLPLKAPQATRAHRKHTAALFAQGVLRMPVARGFDHPGWAEAIACAQHGDWLGKLVMRW